MSLAAVTQLVEDKLRSLALGRELASPLVTQRAIEQAVLQYSLDAPQRLQVLVPNVSGYSLAVPTGWVDGASVLEHVEWPVGRAPMATINASVARDLLDEWRILLLTGSLLDETVRVHFTAPHTLADAPETNTVPARHLHALACWVAAELCRQLATLKGHERDSTISAAATNGQSQSGELARRATDWLKQYRQALGLPDTDMADAAGQVVQLPRERRRGRFHSLGY